MSHSARRQSGTRQCSMLSCRVAVSVVVAAAGTSLVPAAAVLCTKASIGGRALKVSCRPVSAPPPLLSDVTPDWTPLLSAASGEDCGKLLAELPRHDAALRLRCRLLRWLSLEMGMLSIIAGSLMLSGCLSSPTLLPPAGDTAPPPSSSPPPDVATCKERLRVLTVGGTRKHNAGVSLD